MCGRLTGRSALTFVSLLWVFAMSGEATAQISDNLRLFGYFQGQFRYSSEIDSPGPDEQTSFTLQQLNLMLSKGFGSQFSAYLNIESTNSFSSAKGWGSLKIEEAWIRYRRSSALNAKVGLLIPTFNNLNEIKNRTPLLPYVVRPLVYETSFAEILPIASFVPQQAYVQVNGSLPVAGAKFDYSAYVGNQDEFIANEAVGSVVAGADSSKALMLGGRLGLRTRLLKDGSLKVGLSSTFDRANLAMLRLGDAKRTRIGADLSFSLTGLYFEGELVAVRHRLSGIQQQLLDLFAQETPDIGNSLDKLFYYGLLGYDITDWLFGYVSYNYLSDQFIAALQDGFQGVTMGLSFKPIEPIVLKAQYLTGRIDHPTLVEYKGNYLFLGVSVFFN